MDADGIPVNVYIDLSKAFDSLDHIILLSKFKFYGVTGVSLDLMSSYLSNRKQCTQFNTTLYCFIDKLATNNINIVINEHLDKVNVWMNSNKLVLNSKKQNTCYFISIIKLDLI